MDVTKALLICGPGHGWTVWVYRKPEFCPAVIVTMAPGAAREMSSVPADSSAWDEDWLRYDRIPDLPPDADGRYGYGYVGRYSASEADAARILGAAHEGILSAGDDEQWLALKRILAEAGHPLSDETRDSYRSLRGSI